MLESDDSEQDVESKALLLELQQLVAQTAGSRERLSFTPGHGARGDLATGNPSPR